MPDDPPTHRYDEAATEVGTVPMSEAQGVRPSAAVQPSSPGGRYVPGAEIGRGGMGRVVVGTDTRLGREVAIKEALPQGADLERFEREVRITARLEHPSIVPLYDAGVTAAGQPFYVMRKVSGRPLDRLIAERSGKAAGPGRERGQLDERLALLPHVLAAAHAIGHAHRRGVIHRDIKPANILVGDLGETVVIDWGLAKVVGEDEALPSPRVDDAIAPSDDVATQTGAVFGTPGFMAPEQARGEPLDPRSDVYALGATLYHVLAGEPPPHGNFAEVIARAHEEHRADAALAALPLPPELIAIAGKAMQFTPAKRYPDGAALADDLNRFLAGRLVTAHHYTRAQRLQRFVRRYRAIVAVVAASAIVLAVGGVVAIRGIVVERERALQAEHEANEGRSAAELARLRESDRADDAVILRARAELERDPTTAIATLATLRSDSRRWPQARSVALEARLRGIAHIYRSDDVLRTFELGPDPRSLLTIGARTGKVSIIDLEHSRERELVTCPTPCSGAWADHGAAVWLAPDTGGLYAVDVSTGAKRAPITSDKIHLLRADPAATYLAFAIQGGGAGMLDAAGMHYVPGGTSAVENLQIAPDGSWVAFATKQELVVVDRAGREFARETGALQPVTLTAAASSKQLAILTGDNVMLELDLTGGLPGGLPGGHASTRRTTLTWQTYPPVYVKDTLYVTLNNAVEMRPLHDLDNRNAEYAWAQCSQETWASHTVICSDKLRLQGPTASIVLSSPIKDPITTIAARPDSRYLATYARNVITTWDLGDMLPELVANEVLDAWIFDDQTAILSDHLAYEWFDLATRVRTPIAMPPGILHHFLSDPATGRAVFILGMPGGPSFTTLAQRGRAETTPIDVPGLQVIDISGPDLVAGTATGELMLLIDRAPPRVVHRFDAAVDMVAANGTWIASQSHSGMLVRWNRATGLLDTAQPPFEVTETTLTRTGDLYLATGRQLYRWRGHGFDLITTLPSTVTTINNIHDRDSVVVVTAQAAAYAIAPDLPEAERVTQLYFRSASPPRLDGTGRYMAVNTYSGDITVLDLTLGTRWRLPYPGTVNSISASGHTALLLRERQLSVLHINTPEDPAALQAWVSQATNYPPDTTGP